MDKKHHQILNQLIDDFNQKTDDELYNDIISNEIIVENKCDTISHHEENKND